MRILLASESKIKLDAVREVFCNNIKGITIKGVKSPSSVHEQPVGYKEMTTGAENRLKYIKENYKGYDIYISIENAIGHIKHTLFIDVGYVLIEINQKRGKGFSASIPIPKDVVSYIAKHNFNKTIGDAVVELYGAKDKNDPHYVLCGIHRKDLLKQAIEIAYNQSKLNYR